MAGSPRRSRNLTGRGRFLGLLIGLALGPSACGEPIAILGDIPGIMRIVAGVPNNSGETTQERAVDALIADPAGVAISADGVLYAAETINARVVAVRSNGQLEVVRADRFCSVEPCLEGPTDIALDPQGRLVIADGSAHRVYRLDVTSGALETLAGTGETGPAADGTPALAADLQVPRGVAVDTDGTIYFSELAGHRVRFIDASGALQTLAGTGVDGFSGDDGDAAAAEISTPGGLGLVTGVLYLADSGNDRIRAIDLDTRTIRTVAGNGTRAFTGDGVEATASGLAFPTDVTPTPDGRRIFIADTRSNRIRHVPFDTGLIETFAGTGATEFTGDQVDAGAASVASPTGVAAGPFGFLFMADPGHDIVWRVVLGF
jgi:sugar lactone lactonase YvrE